MTKAITITALICFLLAGTAVISILSRGSMQAIQDNVTNIFSTPEPAPSPQQQSNPCPAK